VASTLAGFSRGEQPYYFFHQAGGEPLVFAGLWDLWLDDEGRRLRSCTIITTSANKTMEPVHHRMPVVLPRGAWDEWLRPGPLGRDRLNELLAPAADDLLEVHAVSTAVNRARNDGPELIAQLTSPHFPTLFKADLTILALVP
jgi:putative SOS response-associated peptidase YedK